MIKQYTYTFINNVACYTLVASSFAQARRHISKVITPRLGWVVTYNGRYHGPAVRNGKCISVAAK
jgi:hypothetical protein